MSTAARAASRAGAGRGTSLSTGPRPTPVTQLQQQRQGPLERPTAGRGAHLNGELVTKRSSLTSAVLRRRNSERREQTRAPHRHDAGHRISYAKPHYEKPISGGRDDPDSKRKTNDWYTSARRQEALTGLAQATSGLAEVSKKLTDATKPAQPFAWADLSEVVNQLPDGHWAYDYVNGVASSIERNHAMDGKQKENVLGEVLQTLGRLSRENDERFQDAES